MLPYLMLVGGPAWKVSINDVISIGSLWIGQAHGWVGQSLGQIGGNLFTGLLVALQTVSFAVIILTDIKGWLWFVYIVDSCWVVLVGATRTTCFTTVYVTVVFFCVVWFVLLFRLRALKAHLNDSIDKYKWSILKHRFNDEYTVKIKVF